MEEITKRLKRVEGQVRGLQRMVEEQRDCEAVLTQLLAARAALDRVGLLIVDRFVAQCLTASDVTDAHPRVARILELVFSRYSALPGAAPASEEESPEPGSTILIIEEE